MKRSCRIVLVPIFITSYLLIPGPVLSQVTLQPWTEVEGTTPGQELGKSVTGVTPSVNLPYRAAVSRNGKSFFYGLITPADTVAQLILAGEIPLIGDFNDDGWSDVVLSRTLNGYDTVLVYWGISTGTDTLNPLIIPAENYGDYLRPTCAGDIDNDSKTDLILTSLFYPLGTNTGKVYIYPNPVSTFTAKWMIEGDSSGAGLGRSCAIGDLNNDGFADLCVRGNNQSYPVQGRFDYVNIYWGVGVDTVDTTLGIQLTDYNLNSAGIAVFDVNGDSVDDLLWTNFIESTLDEEVWIHYGRAVFEMAPDLALTNPVFSADVISNAGDMNGDGFDDIVVGTPRATVTSGFIFVHGAGPEIDSDFDAAVGMSTNSDFGWSVSSVGDVSGDGLADIIVGAPAYTFGDDKGYWGIFPGDSSITTTDVLSSENTPSVFRLYQCYPNPLNPQATIQYDLNTKAYVNLEVYSLLGQRVCILVDGVRDPGSYEVKLDASPLSSGSYFYRLVATEEQGRTSSQSKKFTIIK